MKRFITVTAIALLSCTAITNADDTQSSASAASFAMTADHADLHDQQAPTVEEARSAAGKFFASHMKSCSGNDYISGVGKLGGGGDVILQVKTSASDSKNNFFINVKTKNILDVDRLNGVEFKGEASLSGVNFLRQVSAESSCRISEWTTQQSITANSDLALYLETLPLDVDLLKENGQWVVDPDYGHGEISCELVSRCLNESTNTSGRIAKVVRTLEEIQLTFDRSKSAFYVIFNRAMRENANMGAGKIVLSITIAPDGSVTNCTLVSSTFGDSELESKIVQRVMKLNFGAKNVPVFTYPNYPINFFPS